jgi:hypothetical protein
VSVSRRLSSAGPSGAGAGSSRASLEASIEGTTRYRTVVGLGFEDVEKVAIGVDAGKGGTAVIEEEENGRTDLRS